MSVEYYPTTDQYLVIDNGKVTAIADTEEEAVNQDFCYEVGDFVDYHSENGGTYRNLQIIKRTRKGIHPCYEFAENSDYRPPPIGARQKDLTPPRDSQDVRYKFSIGDRVSFSDQMKLGDYGILKGKLEYDGKSWHPVYLLTNEQWVKEKDLIEKLSFHKHRAVFNIVQIVNAKNTEDTEYGVFMRKDVYERGETSGPMSKSDGGYGKHLKSFKSKDEARNYVFEQSVKYDEYALFD